jgi:SAM-dependent methyltransferase
VRSENGAFDEHVAAHYEAWYETPEGRRADQLEKTALGRLLQRFPGSVSVLEIGCGTGHFTRWLDDQGLMTVGLDLSWAMLTEAQGLDSVPVVQSDAGQLPFADGAFDLAAFITTLEFLERPREALAEALRVARCGVVLGVLNRWSALGLQRRLAGLLHPTIYEAAHFYGVAELKRLLWSVTGGTGHIVWHTTLFPYQTRSQRPRTHGQRPRTQEQGPQWPWSPASLPWGGFIAMTLDARSRSADLRSTSTSRETASRPSVQTERSGRSGSRGDT